MSLAVGKFSEKLLPVDIFRVAIHQLLSINPLSGYFSPEEVTGTPLSSEKTDILCPGNELILQFSDRKSVV